MATAQPHLEHRRTGFYWRRRVPAREACRFIPAFFCFSLQTQISREAAELARRLTAISDLCFNAESDVSPEVMTQILVNFARLEIETADRLRALTGPRTREAAEASLAIEAAARASLRDAIFLCKRDPALTPIRDTAARLGIQVDEREEDFAILADRMLRLMIEISDENERRARGHFAEPQPYLSMALSESATEDHASCTAVTVSGSTPATAAPLASAEAETIPAKTAALPSEKGSASQTSIFEASDGLTLDVTHAVPSPAAAAGQDPRLVDLWDNWFDERSRGLTRSGAYTYEDAGKAERFQKDADTVCSTRKLVVDFFGERPMSQISGPDWSAFNDMLRRLPNNHGRSSKLRDLSCEAFIKRADDQEARQLRAAQKEIAAKHLSDDDKEILLRKARVARISPRTFQRHQKYLSAPLDHAVAIGTLAQNPFKPYVVGEALIDEMRKGSADTRRKIWTSDDLDELLSTEKWTSPRTQIDDHVYWVPIIARLHGLRSEEILQLKPENIRCDDGIHFFDIERGTGQSAKSENARRMVPLHSQLIELGFLDLVERQKDSGKPRIFAKVSRSKTKKLAFSTNFTKNFNYYRRSRKVYNERRDLHAMRTTFNTKCVGLSIPDTARRYLMGHRNDDVGIVNYLPEGFPLTKLKEYIEMQTIDMTMVTHRFATTSKPAATGPRLAVADGVRLAG